MNETEKNHPRTDMPVEQRRKLIKQIAVATAAATVIVLADATKNVAFAD
jgi:hypothetical protein